MYQKIYLIEPHLVWYRFFTYNSSFTDNKIVELDEFEYVFDCYSEMYCQCDRNEKNVNLVNAFEKLLL